MEKTVKADLHMHPHFSQPRDSKRAPSLRTIVETLFSKGLRITSISAMHPKQHKIDIRFLAYMDQRSQLEPDFRFDYKPELFLYVERKVPVDNQPSSIFLLNSQEARTDYRGMPADINIIGVSRIIEPGQDIDETAHIGKQEGGIVLVCHPNSQCGAGIEKALELYDEGKVDGIELDATASRQDTTESMLSLLPNIKLLPVSDSHHISQAGAAYAAFPSEILNDFSIQTLGEFTRKGLFESHPGQVRRLSRFLHHDLHIYASIPGHLLKNPRYIINALRKRKQ